MPLGDLIVAELKRRGWRLATAESCTAGALASRFAGLKGASDVFFGGVVTYRKEAKTALLAVPERMLAQPSGAVSAAVVERMAQGLLALSRADMAVATTGVAGPQEDEDGNPVGLVYVGLADGGGTRSRRLDLGRRPPDEICGLAVEAATVLVAEALGLEAERSAGRAVGRDEPTGRPAMTVRSDLAVAPYDGTVNVRFLDTVLASTDRALVVNHEGVKDQVFIPFDDIYFEFLSRSRNRETCPVKGEATLWDIQAAGRAEHDAMRSYGANEASAPLKRYGLFDAAKVTIEKVPGDAPVA